MATYEEWNRAILSYTISGAARGARIYLAIDDEAIEHIASVLQTTPEDFAKAVRLRCVIHTRIKLERVYSTVSYNYTEPPRYLALLSAMVLAAHRMGDDSSLDAKNYFFYFNRLLDLHAEGRPPGLENSAEEKLWQDWSIWLRYNGFQPTAHKIHETHTYTYAVSQAMLRQSDKNALWGHFASIPHKYSDTLAKDELISTLQGNAAYLTNHIKRLLNEEGKIGALRYEDLATTIYEVFAEWHDSGRPRERLSTSHITRLRSIRAGLYRSEDVITGQIEYYLLPRQPQKSVHTSTFSILWDDEISLSVERSGWFEIVQRALTISELSQGINLPVKGNPQIEYLILPKRDFWILPPDPDDTTSGVYASWSERPEVGEPVVLLCTPDLADDLSMLRKQGLIEWQKITPVENWLEYFGVMSISDAWDGINLKHQELISQLRPRSYVGLSLRHGLRDPQSGAWLAGYGPEIVAPSFEGEAQIIISDFTSEATLAVFSKVQSGVPVSWSWSDPGQYRVSVVSGGQKRERMVRIIEWTELSISVLTQMPPLLNNVNVFGAWLD